MTNDGSKSVFSQHVAKVPERALVRHDEAEPTESEQAQLEARLDTLAADLRRFFR